MSDLKDIFKKRYEAEVQPQFSDDAWQKFMQYKEDQTPEKKNRNFLFWIILGLFTLVGGSAYMINQWTDQNIIVQQYQEEEKISTLDNEQSITTLNQSKATNSVTDTPITSNNITNTYNAPNIQSLSSNNNTSNTPVTSAPIQKNTSSFQNQITEEAKSSEQQQQQQQQLNTSTPNYSDNPAINGFEREEIKDKEAGHWLKEAILVADLGRHDIAVLDHEYNLDPYITPVHRMSSSPNWATELMVGYGNPMHRSIRNYNQQVYSIAQHYKISSQWSIQGIATIQSLNYTSVVQNLRLGLRSVPLPRSSMNLDEINSQTTYLETGIGVTYTQPLFSGFSLRFGPQFLYIRELSRNLDYQFSDMENNVEAISQPLEELTSHPYNLGMNLSLQYQLRRDMQAGINGSYITSLQNSRQILPNQWRLAIGITKNY